MKQTDASNNRITTIVTILQLNFDKIMLHKAQQRYSFKYNDSYNNGQNKELNRKSGYYYIYILHFYVHCRKLILNLNIVMSIKIVIFKRMKQQ